MREIVDIYLQKSSMKAKDPWQLYAKAGLVLFLLVTLYGLILYIGAKHYVALFMLSATYGFVMAVAQFNIMHDGSHRSFSKKAWINKLASQLTMFAGAAPSLWHLKHVKLHHSAPGVFGTDSDIDQGPIFRFHRDSPLCWYHRYQYLYALPVYCCLSLYWTPKDLLLARKHKGEYSDVYIAVVLNVIIHLIIPYIVFKSILHTVTFFLIYNFALSIILALVFVPAHTCSLVRMLSVEENNSLDFMTRQVISTADFNPQNKLLNFLTGGLNNQVTHHLFPWVCHLHYPKIQPLVEQYCHEHGIAYHQFSSFRQGIFNHLSYIRKMGGTAKVD